MLNTLLLLKCGA